MCVSAHGISRPAVTFARVEPPSTAELVHDLNNLLLAIRGYAELILAGESPPEVVRRVEEIQRSAVRASAIAGELRRLSAGT